MRQPTLIYDGECGFCRRAVGLVYLIAFSSLRRQVPGLFGRHGIVPLDPALRGVKTLLPPARRWRSSPTLLWLGASDERLDRLCAVGEACGAAMMVDLAP